MFRSRNIIPLSLMLVVLATLSCRRELQPPEVQNQLLVPLVNSSLSINDIAGDSLISLGGDGEAILVYRSSLYKNSLGSFQPLETREFLQVAKLQNLSLGSQSAVRTVSLGQVALQSGPIGFIIIGQHGSNASIPEIQGLDYGPLFIDGSEFFETITLDSGIMDIRIKNEFPTDIANVDFQIFNASDTNNPIGTGFIPLIPAGGTETDTVNLAGKTVEGQLVGKITNFDVVGTNGNMVPIDTSDQLIVTLKVRDTKVVSATAIFPAQDVITLLDTVELQNVRDIRGVKAKAATGFVEMRVVSTVEDTLFFDYEIPEGRKDGLPFQISEAIPPAPSGGSITREYKFDVSGYTFDLTGQPVIPSGGFNAFYSELFGRIDSTGKLVNLSLNDSILMYVKLTDFIPEYIEGYLGNIRTDVGPDVAPLNLFNSFGGGELNFSDIQLTFGVENQNGVPFEVEVIKLDAINSKTGESASLDVSGLPNPVLINPSPAPDLTWDQTWSISNATDELNEVLNIFPNQLQYEMRVESNPDMDSNNLNQFAVDSNQLDAFVDLEIPMDFEANDLILSDTIEFNGSKISSPEQIMGGKLFLIGYNGLPLSAGMKMDFYDQNFQLMETIEFDEVLKAAQTNTNGKATKAIKSVLEWPFDRSNLDQILASKYIIVTGSFNTAGSGPIKLYSTDNLDFTLSGEFEYIYGRE